MANAPAFQFYVQDFLTGTMYMSSTEVGAYILLLCHQWDKGSLPSDEKELRKIARCTTGTLNTILTKFTKKDGKYYNERMEAERAKLAEFKRSKSEAGAKGMESRWGKNNRIDNNKAITDNNTVITEVITKDNPSSSTSISSSTNSLTLTSGGKFKMEIPVSQYLTSCKHEMVVSVLRLHPDLSMPEVFARLDAEYPPAYEWGDHNHPYNALKQLCKIMDEEKRRGLSKYKTKSHEKSTTGLADNPETQRELRESAKPIVLNRNKD